MPLAIALDALCVLVFALIGRSSHAEGLSVVGVLQTAWPFLLGLAVGTAIAAALRLGPRSAHWGVCAWVSTVAGGMLTRHLEHEGTAPAFVLVASGFVGLALLGWRLAATRFTQRA